MTPIEKIYQELESKDLKMIRYTHRQTIRLLNKILRSREEKEKQLTIKT